MANILAVLEQFVALVGHLAWPVAALIGFYMIRREFRQIVLRLAERIGDPRSDLSIGRAGLEIRQRLTEPDDSSDVLDAQIQTEPEFEGKLLAWIRDKGLTISVTSFVYGDAYKAEREAAVQRLLSTASQGDN